MPTDNHQYNTPQEGDTDWHIPVNANWNSLDTDIPIFDTDANRSNYTGKSGAWFVASDTGDVYAGTGSGWSQLGTLDGPSDLTDGTTTVTDPSEATFTASGAASVDVVDDGDGTATVDISATDTDTHIDVQDGGGSLASDIAALNLGSNLSGSLDGSTVTVSATAGSSVFSDIGSDNPSGGDIYETPQTADEIRFGVANTELFTDVGVNAGNPPFDYGGGSFAFDNDADRFIGHDGTGFKELAYVSDVTSSSGAELNDSSYINWTTDPTTQPYDKKVISDEQNKEIYVDSANGSDSNDGSSGSPYKTLAKAFAETPLINAHAVDIILQNNYTYQGNSPELVSWVFGGNDGRIILRSDTGGPYTIDLDRGDGTSSSLSIQTIGNEPKDCFSIQDLNFQNCRIKPRNSSIEVKDCTLKSDANSTDVPFGGYLSDIELDNVDIDGTLGVVNPSHDNLFIRNDLSGTADYLVAGFGGANLTVRVKTGAFNITLNDPGGSPDGSGYLEPGLPGPVDIRFDHTVAENGTISAYNI